MKTCNFCGTENDQHAKFCCHCGYKFEQSVHNEAKHESTQSTRSNFATFCYCLGMAYPFIKRGFKFIFYFLVIAGLGAFVWYNSLPEYHIRPETSRVVFDADGGSIELQIDTDADYGSWHIGESSSWYTVTKNAYSITIDCAKNRGHNRTHSFSIYCDGKNEYEPEYINVVQEGRH